MARRNILIIGSGGHARVVLDAIRAGTGLNPVGFLDDHRPYGAIIDDLPVLGATDRLQDVGRELSAGAIVAIGANYTRRTIVERIESARNSVEWLTVIHPSAVISTTANIGAGSIVMAGCVINPNVVLGNHVIVNTHSSIDHDSTMGDFSSTGPGVATGGNTRIGHGSYIGIGATLIHGTSVGIDSVIGAGAVVLDRIGDLSVAYGTPARIVKSRSRDDAYL